MIRYIHTFHQKLLQDQREYHSYQFDDLFLILQDVFVTSTNRRERRRILLYYCVDQHRFQKIYGEHDDLLPN
jgi:hypothetical protein